MNKRVLFSLVFIFCLITATAHSHATKLSPQKVDDPFSDSKCPSFVILSYGSYIYNAPSKYDVVFWPETNENWIWQCPKSGYTSLGSDFDELTDSHRARIRPFLTKHYSQDDPPMDLETRLLFMEKIYELRERDNSFWSWFYRLMAYWHDKLGKPEVASNYRKKALPLIESLASELDPGVGKIEAAYLAGEYHRRIGHPEEAKKYFSQAKAIRWTNDDGDIQVGNEFFDSLIDDRLALMRQGE